jgi:hypothetical protein
LRDPISKYNTENSESPNKTQSQTMTKTFS